MVNLENYKSREQVPINCDGCGKNFTRTKHQIQKSIRLGQKLYCSKLCFDEQKAIKEKECKYCNETFMPGEKEQVFCSQSCAAKYNNQHRIRKSPREINLCRRCNTSTKNPKYCSNECQIEYEWEEKKSKVDPLDVARTWKNNGSIKRYLYELRGKACEICGTDKWMGEDVPLILDHINGNSDNNSLENLRLVCGNCDMQLPTYKSKNKGNGRHYRRIRYSEGKSY